MSPAHTPLFCWHLLFSPWICTQTTQSQALQTSKSVDTVEQIKTNLINAGMQMMNITKNAKEKI